MSDWLQPTLILVGAVLGSSVLTAAVTLYFTRGRTAAEAKSFEADASAKHAEAHKIDSDASRIEAETVRMLYGEIRTAIGQWADCTKERAEALAENEQLKRTAELLRQENVAKDKTITELHGRLSNG